MGLLNCFPVALRGQAELFWPIVNFWITFPNALSLLLQSNSPFIFAQPREWQRAPKPQFQLAVQPIVVPSCAGQASRGCGGTQKHVPGLAQKGAIWVWSHKTCWCVFLIN